MIILVFGNAIFKKDSIALRVADLLRGTHGIEFVECDTAEDIERYGPDLLILDVAKGIDRIMLLENLDIFESSPTYSMHDFDLVLSLKLLKKLGKIRSVRIIALPMGMKEKEAAEAVMRLLKTI